MSEITVEKLAEKIKVSSDVLVAQLQAAGVDCKDVHHVVTDVQMQRLLEKLSGDQPGRLTITRQKRENLKLDADGDKVVTVVTKRRRIVQQPVGVPQVAEPVVAPEVSAPVVHEDDLVPAEAAEVISMDAAAFVDAPVLDTPEVPVGPMIPVPFVPEIVPLPASEEEGFAKKGQTRKKRRRPPEVIIEEEPEMAIVEDLWSEPAEDAPRKKAPLAVQKRKVAPIKRSMKTNQKHGFERPTARRVHEVEVPEALAVGELAQRMSLKASEVIKCLMKMGVMATINQSIDQDTAVLIVEELGHKPVLIETVTAEAMIDAQARGALQPRPPIVTIMGHVDHGKTSLLDYIRRTKVAAGEAGGITQHIGAYHVQTPRGVITFLDTPGHAAFSAMRARGAKCTDLVIIVVAADDGIRPQTIEAIAHAKAAGVPIIVAVNKMDKPGADAEQVKQELTQQSVLIEEWGGDTMLVPVSAKTGEGIDALLEAILLQAEVLELRAPVEGPAIGVVVESALDKGRGPIATILVKVGTLHVGDMLLCGTYYGRIRAMLNEQGIAVSHATPSIPVQVLGLSGMPSAGEAAAVVADERQARDIATVRQNKDREVKMAKQQSTKMEDFMERMGESATRCLNIILKTDVQGSVEVLAEALTALTTEEVKVVIVGRGVGGINESDVNLAMASHAILIGFNVRADVVARRLVQQESISLQYYSIIYDVIDAVKAAVTGMMTPRFQDKILGVAEVRDVFKSSKLGAIAGCTVREGLVKRNRPIRVLRDNVVIYEGSLESLRRFKEDVNEVKQGIECGIGVKNYNDIKPGDQIEVYEKERIEPTAAR